MLQRLRLRSRPLVALLAAIAAVAGCQQPLTGLKVTPGLTRVATGMAVVSADPRALGARLSPRRVQGVGFRAPAITQLRLSPVGTDGELGSGVTVPYTGTDPAVMPTSPLTLTVPAGPNRLFVLEGLDAEGRVLAELTTAATLTAGAAFSLRFDGETDIVARAIHDAQEVPGASTFQAEVAASDVVATLLAFVDASVGLDAATNQFTGVDPLAYDRPALVALLAVGGVAGLPTTPPAASFGEQRWGRLVVQPTQMNGRTKYPPFGLTVELFDPASGNALTYEDANAVGEFVFPKVAPGEWYVRIQAAGGAPASWERVKVQGDTYRRVRAVAPPAPAVTLMAGTAPAIAGQTNGAGSLLVWQAGTGAGAEIMGQFFNASRQPVGAPVNISARAGADVAPVAAFNPVQNRYVVAWRDETGSVFARSVGLDGTLAATTFTDTALAEYQPAIACNSTDGTLLLAYNGPSGVKVSKLTDSGNGDLSGSAVTAFVSGTQTKDPAVAYNRMADQYLVAYAESTDVYAQTMSGDATTVLQGAQLIAGGAGDQGAPAVGSRAAGAALATVGSYGNEFLVAWEHDNGSREIRARRVPSGGQAPTEPEQMISSGGESSRPRVDFMPAFISGALHADHYLVAWEQGAVGSRDIHARRVSTSVMQPLDNLGEMDLSQQTVADGINDVAAAVWADPANRGYVVVWQGGASVRQSIVR